MSKNLRKVINASSKTKKRKQKIIDRSNFIPYACFYDSNTVLTKNGELLQTIRYSPFSADQNNSVNFDIRKNIKDALMSIDDISDLSFYIHTVRDSRSIEWSLLKEKTTFDYELHKQWREINKFGGIFVNEVFVTIVARGKDYPLTKPSAIFSFFNSAKLQKDFFSFLESSVNKLNKVTGVLMNGTADVNPSKLGFYKGDDDLYRSEHLEFFDKLINMINEDCHLPLADISHFLNVSNYKIGFSDILVKTPLDSERFVAVFSLKDHQDMSLNLIDKLLSVPIKMTISQYFDNTKYPLAKRYYQESAKLLQMSEDNTFYKNSGIFDIAQDDGKNPKHFGETQVSITVYANTKIELLKNLTKFNDAIAEIGFCAIREDIFNEDTFYAILPANYSFLARRKYSHLSKFAAFAIRATYPTGNEKPQKWKQPITVFTTIRHTPYFFNYHVDETSPGHTIIIGPKGSGASVLSNFLVSESLKLKPRVISLCVDNASDIFFESIAGIAKTYSLDLAGSKKGLKINPFSLFHSKKEFVHNAISDNLIFIKSYLVMMLELDAQRLNQDEIKDLDLAINQLQKDYNAVTSIKDFIKFFKLQSNVSRLGRYLHDGDMFGMFSLDDDDFDDFDYIISINIEEVLANQNIRDIIMEYIFYRINTELNGQKMIIKLDDVMELFNTHHFRPGIFEKWLHKLSKYNAVCLINLDTSNPYQIEEHISQELFDACDSHFFLPEPIFHQTYLTNNDELVKREDVLLEFYEKACKMNQSTIKIFKQMSNKVHKNILLRHNGLDAILDFNLSEAPFLLAILNSSLEVRELFESIKNQNPNDTFADLFKKFCKSLSFDS